MTATTAPETGSGLSPQLDTTSLQQRLHRAERINRLKSLALIAPLVLFYC